MSNVRNKFQGVQQYLNNVCLERQDEVRIMLAALIARAHVFMLGLPGVGKSYMIQKMVECIDGGNDFYHLMAASTKSEELYGQFSLKELRNDRLVHKYEGKLPDAHVAFLDEIWKSNSTVLNTLLNVMNERTFVNGDEGTMKVPLISLFSASNELPQDEVLNALYDRFTVRLNVLPLQDDDSFEQLMLGNITADKPDALTLNDINEACEQAKQVDATPLIKCLVEFRSQIMLPEYSIDAYISDRRYGMIVSFIKALAWLDGVNVADEDYMIDALETMWERPEQREKIGQVLTSFHSPTVKNAIQDLDTKRILLDEALDPKLSHSEFSEVFERLKSYRGDLVSKIERTPEKAPQLTKILNEFDREFKRVKKVFRKRMRS